MRFPDKARGKVCDLFWLLLGGDLTEGDDLCRLLVPQFPRKIGGGVHLFRTVRLIGRLRYYPRVDCLISHSQARHV